MEEIEKKFREKAPLDSVYPEFLKFLIELENERNSNNGETRAKMAYCIYKDIIDNNNNFVYVSHNVEKDECEISQASTLYGVNSIITALGKSSNHEFFNYELLKTCLGFMTEKFNTLSEEQKKNITDSIFSFLYNNIEDVPSIDVCSLFRLKYHKYD